jgi:hypothetical protein
MPTKTSDTTRDQAAPGGTLASEEDKDEVSETLTEALHRLGRAGFARRFEPVDGALRCASCEVSFPPEELVVEEVVEVADESAGVRSTLYALRCTDCGARGTWILTGAGPADIALLHRMGGSEGSGRVPRASGSSGDAG